ncbi:hypothetical protein LX36DRAFT_99432 [Colletotrichum falcatum]|nr:hypothetical protein LX36DRAFT_99432 [Colletotrichum falcatum]
MGALEAAAFVFGRLQRRRLLLFSFFFFSLTLRVVDKSRKTHNHPSRSEARDHERAAPALRLSTCRRRPLGKPEHERDGLLPRTHQTASSEAISYTGIRLPREFLLVSEKPPPVVGLVVWGFGDLVRAHSVHEQRPVAPFSEPFVCRTSWAGHRKRKWDVKSLARKRPHCIVIYLAFARLPKLVPRPVISLVVGRPTGPLVFLDTIRLDNACRVCPSAST